MDALVIIDPTRYQRRPGKPADPRRTLRFLHFGPPDECLVTFLICPPDDLAPVIKIQRLGK